MDLPSFLFQILEQELQLVQEKLLLRVADKYQLDFETLKKEFLQPLALVPSTEGGTQIKVIRQQAKRSIPDVEDRCMARIWNRGLGGQCSRKKCNNQPLCMQHQNELIKNNQLRHGYYEHAPPMDVFTGNHKIVYK